MVITFYKDYLEKLIATLVPLNSTPPMAKLTIQLLIKQKQKQLTRCAKKRAEWSNKENYESVWFLRARSQ